MNLLWVFLDLIFFALECQITLWEPYTNGNHTFGNQELFGYFRKDVNVFGDQLQFLENKMDSCI